MHRTQQWLVGRLCGIHADLCKEIGVRICCNDFRRANIARLCEEGQYHDVPRRREPGGRLYR